ncbi:MAG: hypothetical protein HOI95_07130, partial [Chromatiales bacterium]|nr:hypothetical protein [Chromatiales bacterium]
MAKGNKGGKKASGRRARRARTTHRLAGEWVGGVFALPVTVAGQPAPDLLTWMEVRSGLVVGQAFAGADDPEGDLGTLLSRTIDEPMVGLPRRPRRVRVADRTLAESVAVAVSELEITVAPTPELDRLMRELSKSFTAGASANDDSKDGLGYLSLTGVSPGLVAALFDASAALWNAAPWLYATDGDVLRVDVPALGIEGACLCIIGAAEQDYGLILFPSVQGYLKFVDQAERHENAPSAAVDLGTTYMSLNFERGAGLPQKMRREIARHRFTVAAPDAHPVVMSVTRHGALLPPQPDDLMLLTACARVTVDFFAAHSGLFGDPYGRPARLDVVTPEGIAVELHGPVAPELFDQAVNVAPSHPLLAADARLAGKLIDFAERHHGPVWWEAFIDEDDLLEPPAFGMPVVIYHVPKEGETLADQFAYAAPVLDADERVVLQAQRNAWLSVWEVTDVTPGTAFAATDALSGESRVVSDTRASESVIPGSHILARVLTAGDDSVLATAHTNLLSPGIALEVVERARKRLRRKRNVPTERLRDPRFCYALVGYWEEAVERAGLLPEQIANTDGDPLLMTTDYFELRGTLDAVQAGLATLDGVEPPPQGASGEDAIWHFTGAPTDRNSPMPNVLHGRAYFTAGRLAVETNSLNRADSLRQRIEKALGANVEQVVREHTDPFSAALPDLSA